MRPSLFKPHLPNLFRRFRRDEEGTVSVEAAFYLPFLLGIFALTYTLFDAFRQESVNIKATYTISDLISRETTELNDDYIDSMYELAQLMIRADTQISMRISVVRWDEDDDAYYVDWSVERGPSLDVWTDGNINSVKDDLPSMPDDERVILVETWNEVNPAFDVGLDAFDIYNFVFTRPRFAAQVAYEGMNPSDGGVHDDNTDSTDL